MEKGVDSLPGEEEQVQKREIQEKNQCALTQEEQKNRLYHLIMDEYDEYCRRRPIYIKAGLYSIVIIPLIFLVLMFSLDSKIIFLVLWIISLLSIAAFLIYEEFVNYRYRNLLSLDYQPLQEEAEADNGEESSGKGEGEEYDR